MSDKFLGTGGGGAVNISNGSTNIFGATIGAANLEPSRPIKTNSVSVLVSSNLDIADVNNLTTDLAQKHSLAFINGGGISQPDAGTLGVYSKADNRLYYQSSTGTEYLMGSGSSSRVGSTEYKFSTSTAAADPGTGKASYDNLDIISATVTYVSHVNQSGTDISNFLNGLAINDAIYHQSQSNADSWVIFNITSVSDLGTYHELGISYSRSSASVAMSNNEITTWVVDRPDPPDEAPKIFSTGIYSGGELVQEDATHYTVSAGTGYIMSETNAYIVVSWSDIVGNLFPAGNADLWVGIDEDQVIHTQLTPWTNEDVRNHIILGQIFSGDLTTISSILSQPSYINNGVSQLRDLSEALGVFNVGGNFWGANGASLSLSKTVGTLYAHGSNFHTSQGSPNIKTLPSLVSPSLFFGTRDDISPSGGVVIDPNQYDLAGVLTPTPTNDWQTLRIYSTLQNSAIVFYGQSVYNDKSAAVQALNSEPFVLNVDASGLLLRSFLVVQEGATDLTDEKQAEFFSANRLGSAAAGGSVPVSTLVNLQTAYNNGSAPHILISGNDGLTLQMDPGTADTEPLILGKDQSGGTTFSLTGDGQCTVDRDLTVNQRLIMSSDIGGAAKNNVIISGNSGGNTIMSDGTYNILIGSQAGLNITTGDHNVSVGHGANNSANGGTNTCIGHNAMYGAAGAVVSGNTCVGSGSMLTATSGSFNACVGSNTLSSILEGNGNVAVGYAAGSVLESGGGNVILGSTANVAASDTFDSIAIGSEVVAATNECVIGATTLSVIKPSSDGVCDLGASTAQFMDIYAAGKLTLGSDIGAAPGNIVIDSDSTAAGALTTGHTNVFIGNNVAQVLQTGTTMCAIGHDSLKSGIFSLNHVALGYETLSGDITGSSCVAVGSQAGRTQTEGVSNIYLGALADTADAASSHRIAIGVASIADKDNQMMIGDASGLIAEIVPGVDNGCDLGSTTNRFKTIYGNVGMAHCFMGKGTSQTIQAASNSYVTVFSTPNSFSGDLTRDLLNGTITVGSDGIYSVSYSLPWGTNGGASLTSRNAVIHVNGNGALNLARSEIPGISGVACCTTSSATVGLSAGDVLRIQVYNADNATSVSLCGSNEWERGMFSVTKLGALLPTTNG